MGSSVSSFISKCENSHRYKGSDSYDYTKPPNPPCRLYYSDYDYPKKLRPQGFDSHDYTKPANPPCRLYHSRPQGSESYDYTKPSKPKNEVVTINKERVIEQRLSDCMHLCSKIAEEVNKNIEDHIRDESMWMVCTSEEINFLSKGNSVVDNNETYIKFEVSYLLSKKEMKLIDSCYEHNIKFLNIIVSKVSYIKLDFIDNKEKK